jgi:hypothetical protein
LVREKTVVDLGTDDDGMRVDPRKVVETYREKAGSEQVAEASEIGFMAGRSKGEGMTDQMWFKILLVILGIVAAITIGPPVAEGLINSGAGGGVGDSLPLWFMPGW